MLSCLDVNIVIMITVMVILNVMVFCVMINMVICQKIYDENCQPNDELALAKGVRNCPTGRPREYTYIQSLV